MYKKTLWKNNETKISAAKLNKLEDGVEASHISSDKNSLDITKANENISAINENISVIEGNVTELRSDVDIINQKIEDGSIGGGAGDVDLTNYFTKTETEKLIDSVKKMNEGVVFPVSKWVLDGDTYKAVLSHNLDIQLSGLNVTMYDTNNESVTLDYKYVDKHTIIIFSDASEEVKVVIKQVARDRENLVNGKEFIIDTWEDDNGMFKHSLKHNLDLTRNSLTIFFYNSENESITLDYKFVNNNVVEVYSDVQDTVIAILKQIVDSEVALPPDLANKINGLLTPVEYIIKLTDWVSSDDGLFYYNLNHNAGMELKNLIVKFYTSKSNIDLDFEFIDRFNLKIYTDEAVDIVAIIHEPQTTLVRSSGGSGDLSDYYTALEINEMLTSYASKEDINIKADKDSVYQKEEVDTKVSLIDSKIDTTNNEVDAIDAKIEVYDASIDTLEKEVNSKADKDLGECKVEFLYKDTEYNFTGVLGGNYCVDEEFNVYIIGGNFSYESKDFKKYIVDTGEYEILASLNAEQDAFLGGTFYRAIVKEGNIIYLVGSNDKCLFYDINTNTWGKLSDEAIFEGAGATKTIGIYNGIIYAINDPGYFHSYNIATKELKRLTTAPNGATNSFVFEYNGDICTITGSGKAQAPNSFQTYNIAKNTWTSKNTGVGIYGAGLVKDGDTIYSCGGTVIGKPKDMYCVLSYSIPNNKWTFIGEDLHKDKNPSYSAVTINKKREIIAIGGMSKISSITTIRQTKSSYLKLASTNNKSIDFIAGTKGELLINNDSNTIHLMDGIKPGGNIVGTPSDLGELSDEVSVISSITDEASMQNIRVCFDGDNFVYLINTSGNIKKYDVINNNWTILQKGSFQGSEFIAEYIKGKIYVVIKLNSKIYVYDTSINTWSELAGVLGAETNMKSQCTSCSYNDLIFAADSTGVLKIDINNNSATKLSTKYTDASNVEYAFDQGPIIGAYNGTLYVTNAKHILCINTTDMSYTDRIANSGIESGMDKYTSCSQFIINNKIYVGNDRVNKAYWKFFDMKLKMWLGPYVSVPEFKTEYDKFFIHNNTPYTISKNDNSIEILTHRAKKIVEVSQGKLTNDKLKEYKGTKGQIVYNTDESDFYVMDGVNAGGKLVGSSNPSLKYIHTNKARIEAGYINTPKPTDTSLKMPDIIVGHTAVSFGTDIYIFGGFIKSTGAEAPYYKFNTITKEFTNLTVTNKRYAYFNCSSFVYNGDMYFTANNRCVDGSTWGGCYIIKVKIDSDTAITLEELPNSPSTGERGSACLVGDYIYGCDDYRYYRYSLKEEISIRTSGGYIKEGMELITDGVNVYRIYRSDIAILDLESVELGEFNFTDVASVPSGDNTYLPKLYIDGEFHIFTDNMKIHIWNNSKNTWRTKEADFMSYIAAYCIFDGSLYSFGGSTAKSLPDGSYVKPIDTVHIMTIESDYMGVSIPTISEKSIREYKGYNAQLVINRDTKDLHIMDGKTNGGYGISKNAEINVRGDKITKTQLSSIIIKHVYWGSNQTIKMREIDLFTDTNTEIKINSATSVMGSLSYAGEENDNNTSSSTNYAQLYLASGGKYCFAKNTLIAPCKVDHIIARYSTDGLLFIYVEDMDGNVYKAFESFPKIGYINQNIYLSDIYHEEIDCVPENLDTLYKIAKSINLDDKFSETVTSSLESKVNKTDSNLIVYELKDFGFTGVIAEIKKGQTYYSNKAVTVGSVTLTTEPQVATENLSIQSNNCTSLTDTYLFVKYAASTLCTKESNKNV